MNHNEKQDLITILDVLEDHQVERRALSQDVKEIKTCLMGDVTKHDDLGLQGAVERNTGFRKSATKGMWVLVTGFIGMAYTTIRSLLK